MWGQVWVGSYYILWALTVALSILIFLMARHLGIIYLTLESAGLRHRPGLPSNSRAPDFAAASLRGETASLRQLRGKRVLLAFIDTNCRFCESVLPQLKAAAESHTQSGVATIVVSRGARAAAENLERYLGRAATVLPEDGHRLWTAYDVPGSPWICIIDENGRVLSNGFLENREQIDRFLGPSRPSVARGGP